MPRKKTAAPLPAAPLHRCPLPLATSELSLVTVRGPGGVLASHAGRMAT